MTEGERIMQREVNLGSIFFAAEGLDGLYVRADDGTYERVPDGEFRGPEGAFCRVGRHHAVIRIPMPVPTPEQMVSGHIDLT